MLSLFVLVGNPLIVVAIMGAMGLRRRTSFLAGLTVAQISEFSLILAALGLRLGQIGKAEVSLSKGFKPKPATEAQRNRHRPGGAWPASIRWMSGAAAWRRGRPHRLPSPNHR